MIKKALATLGISSSVVTILINLIPDTGTKILLFLLFGIIAFGVSWGLKNVYTTLQGLVIGLIVGVFIGITVAMIDNTLTSIPESPTYYLVLSLKWIFPIAAYTYFGVDPWK
jgi:hypothetical protein